MLEQLFGSSLIVGALVALVHAIRLAIPDVSKALASRAEARLAEINAIVAASVDLRKRLDQCEQEHRARAERDRQTAAELGRLRGMISRLREEISVLRSNQATNRPEGQD